MVVLAYELIRLLGAKLKLCVLVEGPGRYPRWGPVLVILIARALRCPNKTSTLSQAFMYTEEVVLAQESWLFKYTGPLTLEGRRKEDCALGQSYTGN